MAGLKLNLRLFTEPRFCTYSSERKGAPGDAGKGNQTLLFTEPVTRPRSNSMLTLLTNTLITQQGSKVNSRNPTQPPP